MGGKQGTFLSLSRLLWSESPPEGQEFPTSEAWEASK